MPLTAGTRLGPYEIVAPLGAGGMGEVYRAQDTRLGRAVAIKVLPQHLSSNADLRARFEREARAVSSLNHPHICTLHDVGREGQTDYLVMELVEGETLADRIARGPLPMTDVLRLGIQITDALDRAHRAGVVHRDLKPGNVMLAKTGAKLMDFGLARATGIAGSAGAGNGSGASGVTIAALTRTPTIASPLTAEGTIVGTYQYMSPEQLEGREADVRSDVWALACVLYEMVAGKPAFAGKSQASLIGAIMHSEPSPLATLAPLTPPGFERIVRSCLAKDPDQRVQTAHDVKLQLSWIAEGGSQAGTPAPVAARRRLGARLGWSLAVLGLAAGVTFGGLWWRAVSQRPRVLRFEIRVPQSLVPLGPLRVSPDGRFAAFAASDSSGLPRLWLRSFDDLECRPLPGTESSGRPFWSPDSRYLGFFSGGKLKKILVAGGRPETICESSGGSDGSWGTKNLILFDGDRAHKNIQVVSASGGVPHAVTAMDSSRHESEAAWPEMLPDGEHFLYVATVTGGGTSELRLASVKSKDAIKVMPYDGRVEYVPPGYIVFERDGALLAQRLDARSGKLEGEPHTLADQIGVNRANSMAFFSTSRTGVLVYSQANTGQRRLGWVDRAGRDQEGLGAPGAYGSFSLSPDGKHLAYAMTDASGSASDIWVRDLERNVSSRFTIDPGDDIWPAWGADSRTLYWASNRKSTYAIYRRSLDGVGDDSLVYQGRQNMGPVDASRDGAWLSCMQSDGAGAWDLLAVPLRGGSVVPIATSKFNETRPHFSPDGRWVAYDANTSGRPELFVQAFPGPGAPVQISSGGGGNALWRSDGKELFYRTPEQVAYAVDVKTGDRFEAGAPRPLFTVTINATGLIGNVGLWAVSADGQRFLFNRPLHAESAWLPIAVFNWTEELRK
jgi:Tol biopolymer transport system component